MAFDMQLKYLSESSSIAIFSRVCIFISPRCFLVSMLISNGIIPPACFSKYFRSVYTLLSAGRSSTMKLSFFISVSPKHANATTISVPMYIVGRLFSTR